LFYLLLYFLLLYFLLKNTIVLLWYFDIETYGSSRGSSVGSQNHARNQVLQMPVQFLETFVDCDLAHPRDAFNLHLGETQAAVLRDEEDDASRHRVRRVVVNKAVPLNLLRDEFSEKGELRVYVQAAAEALDEECRRGLAELLARHVRLAAVDIV